MNFSLNDALQGVLRPAAASATPGPALVLGAGGWLGAALLTQVLAAGHSRVGALVPQRLASTHSGLVGLAPETLAAPDARARERWAAATAYVVLERPGLQGSRDAAFVSPDVAELPRLAAQLRGLGATRLFVVVPHAPSSLPEALRHGFADAHEQALSAMGFEQLVLVRSSREALGLPAGSSWLQRFAAAWWSQLRWILPDAERPLRSVALARVVVAVERLLRQAGPGVRVLTQEQASRALQSGQDLDRALRAWAGLETAPV
jgi:hypothetical protein